LVTLYTAFKQLTAFQSYQLTVMPLVSCVCLKTPKQSRCK